MSTLDTLLNQFNNSVETSAVNPTEVYVALKKLNPYFNYQTYSPDKKADLLANIVAAIYAPLINAFISTILDKIELEEIPNIIFVPPRDAIPLFLSIIEQAKNRNIYIEILDPSLNRKILGINNNQSDEDAVEDPLVNKYIFQTFAQHNGMSILEIETGIYGTTTLALANKFKELGLDIKILPIKMYGLGPNLSFFHYLLSGSWNAMQTNLNCVDIINAAMILLDSLEEFGMQNYYASPSQLADNGQFVYPIFNFNSPEVIRMAKAANSAIVATAKLYTGETGNEVALNILKNIDRLVVHALEGLPLCFVDAIPSMDDKEGHYIRFKKAILDGNILQMEL